MSGRAGREGGAGTAERAAQSLGGGIRARIATLFAALFLVAVATVACGDEQPVATLPEDRVFENAESVSTGGATTITNREGIRTAHLRFDTLWQHADSTHHTLSGVNLLVYNEETGMERGSVVSDRGAWDPRSGSLTARENVVLLVPGQQRRLETSEVHFDPDSEQLWSDSSFVMTEAGRTVRGSSFTTDLEFRNFEVRGVGGNDE